MISNLLQGFRKPPGKAVVLMYHRIADLNTDPWQLGVTRQNFEQQLQILQRDYKVLPLRTLIHNFKSKKITHKSVCLTFDDAYTDNYLFAKPLLEQYNCPATFFVPSAHIGSTALFWWDELESVILNSEILPRMISININNEPFEYRVEDAILTKELELKQQAWIWTDTPPTQRCRLYLEIWKRLKPLPTEQIAAVIKQVTQWAQYEVPDNAKSLPMSKTQLNEIAQHPLFELGVHTATHPALSAHAADVQYQEIANCKNFLEKLTGKQVNSIAYPYGDYNDTTIEIVKEQGLSAAFTTQAQTITKKDDAFRLGRFQVVNQNGNDFKKQMQQWIS